MTKAISKRAQQMFADVPASVGAHFRLSFEGMILAFVEHLVRCFGSFEAALQRFPFLAAYNNALATRVGGMASGHAQARWWTALNAWEEKAPLHLPLRALRQAAELSHEDLAWLLAVGIVEEDARFGAVCATFNGTGLPARPSFGLLREFGSDSDAEAVNLPRLLRFESLGLVRILNPDAPRQEWLLQIPPLIWHGMRRGELLPSPWLRHQKTPGRKLDELVLRPAERAALAAVPALFAQRLARTLIVRGPRHNGRRTALAAVAGELGRGVLAGPGLEQPGDERWRQVGTLAVLLHAMPLLSVDPVLGENTTLPELWPEALPVGVACGRTGGLRGPLADHAVTVSLEMPGLEARGELWRQCLNGSGPLLAATLADQFRLASGNILRTARIAQAQAGLNAEAKLDAPLVRAATRLLERPGIDTLARRLPDGAEGLTLCANPRTQTELAHLELRCRHRERLATDGPAALTRAPNCGVRVLFCGPSGTGKTLAARCLGTRLNKDVYQLDLSAVVNKYIGETEKNLSRVFECAEELDVLLLLDEGDALLTRRTDVHTANDRYANLETNFLLQRLESYEGILIVTTNSRERIDSAFERRMDVTVEFPFPDAALRLELWRAHLPADRGADEAILHEIAARCELSGGQIRNAALHAALLACDQNSALSPEHLKIATLREYQKRGAVCPLRNA